MTKNVHYLKVSQNLVYKMLLLPFTAAKAVGTIINLKLLGEKKSCCSLIRVLLNTLFVIQNNG